MTETLRNTLLAKLKIFLNKSPGDNPTLTELMKVANFDLIIQHVSETMIGDTASKKGSPSTAIIYGEILSELIDCILVHAVRKQESDDTEARREEKK